MTYKSEFKRILKNHENYVKNNPEEAKKRAEEASKNIAKRKAFGVSVRKFAESKSGEIKQFFETEAKDNLDAPIVLATILEAFDLDDQYISSLYLQWTVEEFVKRKIKPWVEKIEKLYDDTVAKSYTKMVVGSTLAKNSELLFNDLDSSVFTLKTPKAWKMKVLCVETKKFNFAFILSERSLHIRQYWDICTVGTLIDELADEDDVVFTENEAILRANELTERYSDAISGNKYVSRPSLQWFYKNKFNFNDGIHRMYGDGRDCGYIYSYSRPYILEGEEISLGQRGDVLNINLINIAILHLDSAISVMEEEISVHEN